MPTMRQVRTLILTGDLGAQRGDAGVELLGGDVVAVFGGLADGVGHHIGLFAVDAGLGEPAGDRERVEHEFRVPRLPEACGEGCEWRRVSSGPRPRAFGSIVTTALEASASSLPEAVPVGFSLLGPAGRIHAMAVSSSRATPRPARYIWPKVVLGAESGATFSMV